MKATFYSNQSDPIVIDKTISTIGLSNITIRYKYDEDLINPTFICNLDTLDWYVNYVYVKEPINRYYYIIDKVFKNNMVELKCKVDPLMSFKEELYEAEYLVWRNQKHYNMYLTDDRQVTEASERVLTFPFPKGFSVGSKTASYILTVNGGAVASNNGGGDEQNE